MEQKDTAEEFDRADLKSQLEDLLAAVRAAEENWRFDDRLDLATRSHRKRR
jgi:hypothetical protein